MENTTMRYEVTIGNINLELLNEQKAKLIELRETIFDDTNSSTMDGIISLLDHITNKIDNGDFVVTIIHT
jgi:hypothetical protein